MKWLRILSLAIYKEEEKVMIFDEFDGLNWRRWRKRCEWRRRWCFPRNEDGGKATMIWCKWKIELKSREEELNSEKKREKKKFSSFHWVLVVSHNRLDSISLYDSDSRSDLMATWSRDPSIISPMKMSCPVTFSWSPWKREDPFSYDWIHFQSVKSSLLLTLTLLSQQTDWLFWLSRESESGRRGDLNSLKVNLSSKDHSEKKVKQTLLKEWNWKWKPSSLLFETLTPTLSRSLHCCPMFEALWEIINIIRQRPSKNFLTEAASVLQNV